jgi:dTDP-4-dehydrorhamnose reductase
MNFFVLGASGMAGHTISLYLQERGHRVLGFDQQKATHCESIVGDARDTSALRTVISQGKFDSVINCIGILNQFAEQNHELAAYLNGYFPHFLASITAGTETQVIHMSTDCVFSGKKGQYTEDDVRDGALFYDRSKAFGELEDDKNITLRNSIIGPDLNPKGIGLFNWFVQQRGDVRGYTRVLWTGLTTLELAKAMEAAANLRAHGLYNMVNNTPISKFDLLSLINQSLLNGQIHMTPVDQAVSDKSLKRTRYDFPYVVPDYATMVSELSSWVLQHKNLYPHYDI